MSADNNPSVKPQSASQSGADSAQQIGNRTPTPYYDEGGITIYHGDSADILPTLKRNSVKAVVTDPPYIIGAVSAGSMGSKAGGWADMMNSTAWFAHWYGLAQRALRTDGALWTFCNWRSLPVVIKAAMQNDMPITSVMVWDKEWIGPGGPQGLRPSYELCALLAQPEFQIPNRGIPDIWRHKVGSYKESGHPAEKPEPLVRRIIACMDPKPTDLFVDPFLGSGTTAVACKTLGVRFIGVEAEERYCEMAVKRLAQGTFDFDAAPQMEDVVGL